jgi:serine/threonine-protein kinase
MEGSVTPRKLAGRYEVRHILGQGGMGLVYRAYDTVIRREVAVKTILDIPDPALLQLFYKECDVLASMSHPNIVEIFDIGEFEEDGKKKPYFVNAASARLNPGRIHPQGEPSPDRRTHGWDYFPELPRPAGGA